MSTLQEKYEKEIKEFLEKHFETYDYKYVNYVEPCGYIHHKGAYVIKTENCGFVYIRPEVDDFHRPYTYTIYTQKFSQKWNNEEKQIFEFSGDSRFKKNNLLCVKCIDIIKDFILSEYK